MKNTPLKILRDRFQHIFIVGDSCLLAVAVIDVERQPNIPCEIHEIIPAILSKWDGSRLLLRRWCVL